MERISFKYFEDMQEEDMDEAINFVLSREEQECLSLDEIPEEEIDPEKYVFIFRASTVVGIFSPQLRKNLEIEDSDRKRETLDRVVEIVDLRVSSLSSVRENTNLVESIMNCSFLNNQRWTLEKTNYLAIFPAPAKTAYFNKLSQVFCQNQVVCYKKI